MLARSIGSGIKSNKRNKEIGQMRKERKVLIERLNELGMQRDAEYEMGCGFGSKEISENFAPYFEELETKLAATYGMTPNEYDNKMFEIDQMVMRKICGLDELPFN